MIEENVEIESLKESVDAHLSSEEKSIQAVASISKENGVSSSVSKNGKTNGYYIIEEEKIETKKSKVSNDAENNWSDLCFQDGIWHKWILERCDEEQKQIYYTLQKRLVEQDLYFTENKILRFLGAHQFNEEEAMQSLIENIEFYDEHDCREFSIEDIQQNIDDQMIVNHKFDKYGRPVVYLRIRFNYPSKYSTRQAMLYLLWNMQQIKKMTPKHIDNYMLIYDMKDAGFNNFSISQMSGSIRSIGSQFPETLYKVFVINHGW